MKEPYVSSKYLHDFPIRYYGLDLRSGLAVDPDTQQPISQSQAISRPMPLEDLRSAIKSNRPWINFWHGHPSLLHWDEKLDGDDFCCAQNIGSHLSMYLSNHHDESEWGLIEGTGWEDAR